MESHEVSNLRLRLPLSHHHFCTGKTIQYGTVQRRVALEWGARECPAERREGQECVLEQLSRGSTSVDACVGIPGVGEREVETRMRKESVWA